MQHSNTPDLAANAAASDAPQRMPFAEFVLLMALLMAITALSIDTVLPALSVMGEALQVSDINDTQFVIGSLFAGFAIGQLIYGPLSDSFGRKRSIYLGLLIFMAGSAISYQTDSFTYMLLGRALQGVGVAATRVVTVAIARDLYAGRDMARVMSIIMAIFIFVPALAPTIGQGVMWVADWRGIFILFIAISLFAMLWMHLRFAESLPMAKRQAFTRAVVWHGVCAVLSNRDTVVYTLCSGLIFGILVVHLSTARQVFQDHFRTGDLFAFYFALTALSIGLASLINSAIVKRFGMRRISFNASVALLVLTALFLGWVALHDGDTPFWSYMVYMPLAFFFIGLLFGNLNALAMEPMGEHAGIASAFLGAVSSIVSVTLGTLISQQYHDSLLPLIAGFFVLASLSLGLMRFATTRP